MITRRGVGIILAAIAVFFLASTTRVGWVHLADAVLWGVAIFSFAVPWLSMPGLRLERTLGRADRSDSPGPVEGDELPLTLTLTNRWWLPRFLVSISYPVTAAGVESDQREVFFWTWPHRASQEQVPLALRRRGRHTLGDSLIEITGPFGMFRRRRRVAMRHSVLAYPRWKPMLGLGLLEARTGEQEGRRRSRTGVDASGTRAYVTGDPYRAIHWRNSARSGRLVVREFDSWNDRAVVFAIDTVHVAGDSPESSLDYAARIAASCGKVIEREGGTMSVVTATGESPEFMTWDSLVQHLANLEREEPGSLAQRIAELQTGRRLMAFLTLGAEDEAAAVGAAARRGIAAAAVVFTEGNQDDLNATRGSSLLLQSAVPVVHCAPGGLDRALHEIETGVGSVPSNRKYEPSGQRLAA